jgi:hypothetical protein
LNKAAVPDHLEGWICGDGLLPPAGHGGEGSELRIASGFPLQGRFFVELNHVGGIHAPVIFCRQGGMSSTSMTEAANPSLELDAPSSPSGASPATWWQPAAVVLRRKEAVERYASAPRRKRLEDAGVWWRRRSWTRLLCIFSSRVFPAK